MKCRDINQYWGTKRLPLQCYFVVQDPTPTAWSISVEALGRLLANNFLVFVTGASVLGRRTAPGTCTLKTSRIYKTPADDLAPAMPHSEALFHGDLWGE